MAEFTHNGLKLFYEEKGDPNGKETIGFLNGVMASTGSWAFMSPVFERLGFRVILHDFKGQLKSDKPAGPYTFAQHCEEAKALYDSLGVKKIHLIGTSYGGEAAMKFASMYPEMTKTISVIDSVSELDAVLRGFVAGWKILCDTGDGEKFFWGMAPSIYSSEFLEKNKDMLAGRALAIKNDPDGYLEGQKTLYDAFNDDVYMTDELPKIKCPALILCGAEDILKPIKFSKIIADAIPNSEFLTIPGSGHVAIFEKPGELVSAILGFIMKNC
jgi:3-oxoadipate enol-lactonase